MTELLVVAHDDVVRLLPAAECIELMRTALSDLARERIWQPLRVAARPPDEPSLIGLMPAHRTAPGRAYALKAVCIFPGNSARGLDPHQGGVLLFDGETGALRAVLDASAITAIRTAAVTAVATDVLARRDARVLAIIGSGVQARAHVAALRLVRSFDEIRVWSRTPEHVRAFAAAARVEAASGAEDAVRGADVVVTVTSARDPVVERDWLDPGTHVNAVGSSIPTTRELDAATIAAASVFVDRRESALNESGEYLRAVEEAGIGPDHIRAELGEVLTGSDPGRKSDGELTVFISLGLAAEDLAAAEHVVARARAEGAGTVVPF
jgi:ornithine cyclodeaminase/alanine dehydrogenase-like protein (mu-crystallin family)